LDDAASSQDIPDPVSGLPTGDKDSSFNNNFSHIMKSIVKQSTKETSQQSSSKKAKDVLEELLTPLWLHHVWASGRTTKKTHQTGSNWRWLQWPKNFLHHHQHPLMLSNYFLQQETFSQTIATGCFLQTWKKFYSVEKIFLLLTSNTR